jgi:hypothetical protein
MNKTDPHNEQDRASRESPSSSVIEADSDGKQQTARRHTDDPDHKKSYRRSWRSASPLTKLQIYLTTVIAIATVLYCGFAGWQLIEIRSGGEETRKIAQAARDSADAAQRQANVSVEQLDAIRKAALAANDSAEAAKKQANASLTQANVSERMARQNESLINSTQTSARAAEQSASIAQNTFRLVYRPSLGVDGIEMTKFKEGEEIEAAIRFKNFGQAIAKNATVRSAFATERAGDINQPCPAVSGTRLSGLSSVSQIPVGGLKLANPRSFIKATPDDIKRIESGEWWLYVYAIVRYEGPTGEQYFTSYYARWNSTARGFDECGSGNEAN